MKCSNIWQKIPIYHIDLEGINSPLRGNNKLGYGGEIKIYYNLELL